MFQRRSNISIFWATIIGLVLGVCAWWFFAHYFPSKWMESPVIANIMALAVGVFLIVVAVMFVCVIMQERSAEAEASKVLGCYKFWEAADADGLALALEDLEIKISGLRKDQEEVLAHASYTLDSRESLELLDKDSEIRRKLALLEKAYEMYA